MKTKIYNTEVNTYEEGVKVYQKRFEEETEELSQMRKEIANLQEKTGIREKEISDQRRVEKINLKQMK